MPAHNANLRSPSCRSVDSFQNLQKLKEIFNRRSANCKNSIQRLFSNSKVTLQDEPINSEFFSYYTTKSSTTFKKGNETKPTDTQSKLTDFFRQCILTNQLFGCNNEPKTKNKACMCKPIRKSSKVNMKPNIANRTKEEKEKENNKEREESEDTSETNEESVINVQERRVDTKSGSQKQPLKRNDFEDSSSKKQPKNKVVMISGSEDNLAPYIDNDVGDISIGKKVLSPRIENSDGKLPKVVLHLPIDLGQFYQPTPGNELKLVLCDNNNKVCGCKYCSSTKKRRFGRHKTKSNKEIDDDELPKDKTLPKKEKPKKSIFSCFKCCKRKSQSKRNQTESPNDIEGGDMKAGARRKKNAKNFEKCTRCNKYDPESPMSGDQADTLKLLIKMEARQNYRQINNILKELNDQHDDIRKLRETYARITEHFPKIFVKHAQGDDISNSEVQENVKTLFRMYKDLSAKINEIHKLSANIVDKNNKSRNEKIPYSKTPSHKASQKKIPSERTSRDKSPIEQFSGSSTLSKSDEDFGQGSTENRLGGMSKSASASASNGLNYDDEVPEKLPKSQAASIKKPSCPCEINWGLYSSNSGK